jgi:ribonuclease HII
MMIGGIDEAGRGSLLGPLVIACVIIDDNNISLLKEIGVKDSKMLKRDKRALLYNKIKDISKKVIVRKINAKNIDNRIYSLNRLEAEVIIDILEHNKVNIAYIDSFDTKPKRLAEFIANNMDYNIKIYAEHKADINYPIVSAASIIAKIERDKAIDKLRVYGNIGSGYPSDYRTINFVKEWVIKHKRYPSFVRVSWKSIKKINDTLPIQTRDPYQKVLD